MYQPIRGQDGHLDFLIGPKNTNLVEDIEFLRHQILFAVSETKSKMSQPMGDPGSQFSFSYQPKNEPVKDIEILLFSFHREIPFGSFRGDENVSANQRSGRPSCFSDRPEKTRGPGALYRAQENHCNLALFFFT